MLLPPATEPFTAPTDRDMLPSERRAFVRTHRTCVFGHGRRHDGPAMSIVYYIPTDDDELLVSAMAGRGKVRAIAGDGKVSLCVLDERWPFAYLQVYADAVIEHDRDLVVDVMMAVAGRMSGQQLGDEARPYVEAMAVREDRVVVRCRPYTTFAQPPRHLHGNGQTQEITHWVSGTVPWDAPDPTKGTSPTKRAPQKLRDVPGPCLRGDFGVALGDLVAVA
jgi:hypothetical protein